MRKLACVFFALLCGATVFGQSSSSGGGPDIGKQRAFVRRFSFGATLSVLGRPIVPDKSTSQITSTPAVNGLYTTAGASQRIGYGVTGQVAVTGHIAVNAMLLYRRMGYLMNTDEYLGTLDPNATIDNRTHQVINEDTRAHLFELPVTIRYFVKERHKPGPNFFFEGGAVVRRVSNIRTSIDTTINSGTTSCCDTTPAVPARRTSRGFVAGMGVHLVDPFGIRVIPEVRYTRWSNQTFQNLSTTMDKNQVEGMLTLSF